MLPCLGSLVCSFLSDHNFKCFFKGSQSVMLPCPRLLFLLCSLWLFLSVLIVSTTTDMSHKPSPDLSSSFKLQCQTSTAVNMCKTEPLNPPPYLVPAHLSGLILWTSCLKFDTNKSGCWLSTYYVPQALCTLLALSYLILGWILLLSSFY